METKVERFTMTDEHVRLLRHAYVRWEDCETGAPAIDCKRPYGNSSVWQDVAEILGIKPAQSDDDEEFYPKGTRDRCMKLHAETEHALQIVLATGSFDPGTFEKVGYGGPWRRLGDGA